MNKTVLYIAFLCCLGINAKAQGNLVPNPSFETYSQCPDLSNQTHYATGWSSFRGTPDYYNRCNNTSSINAEMFGVPKNGTGYQYAADGDAYCVLFSWPKGGGEEIELIGCKLITPLDSGVTYCVSVKFNFPYKAENPCGNTALKNIGIQFTNTQYSGLSPMPLNNICHVCGDEFISDTLKWIQIKGEFTPTQSYSFLAIGNFFNDSATETKQLFTPTNCGNCSSYYVDDVIVSADLSLCNEKTEVVEVTIPNVFTPNNDNINDTIDFSAFEKGSVFIYNRWGNVVFTNDNITLWYGTDLSGKKLVDGVYFYMIKGRKKQNGFIHLIR